jgi:hypothetical protein
MELLTGGHMETKADSAHKVSGIPFMSQDALFHSSPKYINRFRISIRLESYDELYC